MKSKASGSIIAIAVAAIGTLVLVGSRSVLIEAVYPLENARRAFMTRVWPCVTGLFGGCAAKAENVRLRRELAGLELLRGDAERLAAENARLRRALGYTARNPGKWLAAGVLSRGGGAAGVHETLRVDRGSSAGVAVGAIVTVPEGLIGRVTDVTPHTAEVTLITDPSVKVACEIDTGAAQRPTGILSGAGGGMLVIRHLRGAEMMPPRAKVLTSGRGGVFPAGLEVGTLLEVRQGPGDLSREGEVLPTVVSATLEDVFIRREG